MKLFLLMTGLVLSSASFAEEGPTSEIELQIGESIELKLADKDLYSSTGFQDGEDLYFDIREVNVERVESSKDFLNDYLNRVSTVDNFSNKDFGTVVMASGRLIALGKEIWKIVEAGRPVLNTDFMDTVSVLPRTDDSPDVAFYEMSHWQAPRFRTYRVTYTNGFGMNVISFNYTVAFQYGGRYNDVGAYLTGVDVSASNISVSWGFELNADSQLLTISNRGRVDDPIAGATIRINYEASSPIRTIKTTETFHVTGDGSVIHVN